MHNSMNHANVLSEGSRLSNSKPDKAAPGQAASPAQRNIYSTLSQIDRQQGRVQPVRVSVPKQHNAKIQTKSTE